MYQQPSLFPDLTVAENIALSLEAGGLWRKIDWRPATRAPGNCWRATGCEIDPDRLVSTLSMPEQQIVEIAKAIGAEARIADPRRADRVAHGAGGGGAVPGDRGLRAEGVGIIYISHRLEEIAMVADRVTVLRDGQSIATRPMADVNRAELIRLMVGREISAIFPKRDVPIGDVVLELRGCAACSRVAASGRDSRDRGTGGSGRTELGGVDLRTAPPAGGEILLRGERVRIGIAGRRDPARDRLCARGSAAARRGARDADRGEHLPGESAGGLAARA